MPRYVDDATLRGMLSGTPSPDSGYASHWADPFYRARYGMGVNEKEAFGLRGGFPGATAGEDPQERQRAASQYLFTKEHPNVAAAVLPTLDLIEGGIGGENAPFWAAPFAAFGATSGQVAAGERGRTGAQDERAGTSNVGNQLGGREPSTNVSTTTGNFRVTPENAPPLPPATLPSVPVPNRPSVLDVPSFIEDPTGTGLGRDAGMSFGFDDQFNAPRGPEVNVSPEDMALAEFNQDRVNRGLPPIDPNTGMPIGPGPTGQPRPDERLPGMHSGAGNPQGGGTGFEALGNVFGGLDPRAQYVSIPDYQRTQAEAEARGREQAAAAGIGSLPTGGQPAGTAGGTAPVGASRTGGGTGNISRLPGGAIPSGVPNQPLPAGIPTRPMTPTTPLANPAAITKVASLLQGDGTLRSFLADKMGRGY